ncbi:MAG: SDR family oxidoreductase [Erysipelothrix sp.]|nr:SDR family oxidoreductase [Erysipelothrix sp.]
MRPKALVTGATKGIGRAIALQLVSDGYDVVGTYVRDYDIETINSLEEEYFSLIQVDGRDSEAVKQCVKEHGPFEVLVNNAGITKDGLVLRMSEADFRDVLDVNLTASFLMTQAVARGMLRAKKGVIINIASVIGEMGNAGQANYAASKSGLIGFTKSIAKEFGSRGVRANCVLPGFIQTDMTDVLSEELVDGIKSGIVLGELGTVDDVAKAVSFLVSANYITGQSLSVCGGLNI